MSWLRLIEERMKAKTPSDVAAADEVPEESVTAVKEAQGGLVAAGDEVRGKPAPKARTRNRFRHLLGEMWPAYLIEIIVIILGISITLALEQWRDGAKEDQLEKIYRGNLAADIESDLGGLQYASAATTALLAHGQEILHAEKGSPTHSLSDTALIIDLRAILERPNFIPHDVTFAELKSSGNLRLVKNVDLKWLLFAYYNQTQVIKEVQDAEQQATITLVGPYFLQRFPMDDRPGNRLIHQKGEGPAALSNDFEFRNLVLLRVGNRRELLALYQAAESMATKLKAALQKN
jgi:hypothetical protein